MRFKVGDKVKVRTDLKVDKSYGTDIFNKYMARFKGRIMTIKEVVDENKTYNLKEDGRWNWTDQMLRKIAHKKT